MADLDPTALIPQLRDALDTCKSTLESNNPAIVDTIWIGPIETLVDRIDDALGAANAFLENPAQEPKRMRSAEDWLEHYVELRMADKTIADVAVTRINFIRAIQQDALASRAAPENWQLVPKEPTQAMIDASYAKELKICGRVMAGMNHSVIYEAMIAAAPPPPATEPQG